MFAKSILATVSLAGLALAGATPKAVCASNQQVVCSGNGNGGLITLGNVLPGALGDSCSGGDVYCCDSSAINQVGLVNLDVNAQCSLNHVL
ncbi:Uncharacterized protein PECH_001451 [Penicillium ucsense]|uniref:Hydrophobin n=1 Tax=Penicillium ucsense TaxID=2839758 RepID=A0A8J8WLU7_9EURO|nr:Uncharacterized protein PECM_001091 [Penicillium ucsense]KAF7738223.1 Uncharacterized protein PECH_001451 [Penicillium ucsense]